jgi:putative RecB family exonuclease
LWRAIETATAAKDFRPNPSKLCGWCNHQERCPEFGGTVLPFPAQLTATTLDARQRRVETAQP